jgi:hypothetical protein
MEYQIFEATTNQDYFSRKTIWPDQLKDYQTVKNILKKNFKEEFNP